MKTKTLSVRVESKLIDDLELIEAKTMIERASIVRASLEAVRAFYEEHGYLQMPFKLVPSSAKPPRG